MLRTVDLLTRTRQLCLMADSPAAAKERPVSDSLMTSRRFAPLFWCQFFSAFNDNFLKNALVFLILFKVAGSNAEALVTLAGAVFIGPFFLLSGIGGELADRYDMAVLARRLKLAEIGAAGLAVVGFWLHSLPVLFAALFSFGTIAALFGPIKYGILPVHLRRAELPAGNALVEAATFLAILLGTVAGGYAARGGGDPASFGGLVIGFAVLCWAASLLIPRTGEAAPDLRVDLNILRSTGALLRDLWADARLWRGGVIVSWFWLVGAVTLSILPPLVKNRLDATEEVVTVLLAVFSVGIAVGSGLASWLASGRIVLLADGDRRAPHGRLRARPRLRGLPCGALDAAGRGAGVLRQIRRLAHRHRLRRARDLRRPVHRAVLRRGSGLGRGGPPRPRHRRRQRALGRLHGGGRARHRRAAEDGRHAADHRRGARRSQRPGRPDHLPDAADEPVPRFPLDPLPGLLPARGEGARERRQGRPERDRGAEPCQLPRRARSRSRSSTRSRSSPSTTASPSAGGCARS